MGCVGTVKNCGRKPGVLHLYPILGYLHHTWCLPEVSDVYVLFRDFLLAELITTNRSQSFPSSANARVRPFG